METSALNHEMRKQAIANQDKPSRARWLIAPCSA
jgi:hypothetical protein